MTELFSKLELIEDTLRDLSGIIGVEGVVKRLRSERKKVLVEIDDFETHVFDCEA